MKRKLIAIAACVFFAGSLSAANAEINLNIGINLPAAVIASPPEVMLIPGTYVYFAPSLDLDIFFFSGYWYRPDRGRWYRANDYNGSWAVISTERVPRVVLHVPTDFRRTPPGHERIPYGQLKKHWKEWERDRHWDGPGHSKHAREERHGNGDHKKDHRKHKHDD